MSNSNFNSCSPIEDRQEAILLSKLPKDFCTVDNVLQALQSLVRVYTFARLGVVKVDSRVECCFKLRFPSMPAEHTAQPRKYAYNARSMWHSNGKGISPYKNATDAATVLGFPS